MEPTLTEILYDTTIKVWPTDDGRSDFLPAMHAVWPFAEIGDVIADMNDDNMFGGVELFSWPVDDRPQAIAEKQSEKQSKWW